MSSNNRPLSPHLDVYRLPLSALLSIVHRGTGAFLSIGSVVLVWWLMALAGGEASFTSAQSFLGSFFGRLILLGWLMVLGIWCGTQAMALKKKPSRNPL